MARLQKRIARPGIGKLVKARVHGIQDIYTYLYIYTYICVSVYSVAYISGQGESINPRIGHVCVCVCNTPVTCCVRVGRRFKMRHF